MSLLDLRALRVCGPACAGRAPNAEPGAGAGPGGSGQRAAPRIVMKTLGHCQIVLTKNTLTHVLPEIERAAVDSAAETIFG